MSDSDNSISIKVERKRTSADLPLSTRIRPTSQFETFKVRTNASSCGRLSARQCLKPNVLREQDLWPTTSPVLVETGHMLGRCSAPSTWIRVVEPVPAWVFWTNPLLSQLTPALLLRLSTTGTIHLLLQHITSPTTATYPGRICPYGRQRLSSLCPPHQVRPHVVPTHWASSPCRPTYPPGTLGGRYGRWVLLPEPFLASTFWRKKEGDAPFQQHQPLTANAPREPDHRPWQSRIIRISMMTTRLLQARGGLRGPSVEEVPGHDEGSLRLARNVRDLIELVRALVDTRRDANVVQFPEEPPEVAESTPSRPPRSSSRPRNPSPTGDRGSDRTHRESPRRQPQERADPSRVRSRSRHSQATRSAAAEPPAVTGDMPGDRVRETVNVKGSTTSVFDRLGRPGVHRRIGRERSVDKPAKDEDYNQNRLDQLQRQLDQLVGQQYGMDQLGAVAPPFTPFIMASSYPTRFKMPSVAPYDDSTVADEHIENYQAHMLIQNANKTALCKSFCLTLTGAARQWYRRLATESIGCFKQLADAFAAAFLSSKTRKLGASHLFGIKQ
ncbi:hypothetical protein TIFTF001_038210 [Ficus carica]|uniref:Retrotransposon gag domain-containing protein n=1 Tax=Ficus carica TaxID=3494 RepID=A0AA88E700_FICCA|nr:hypothetical protein TIFTF001_038210 [Ficus carica]